MNCHGKSVFHVKIGKQQDQWIPIILSATQITGFFFSSLVYSGVLWIETFDGYTWF